MCSLSQSSMSEQHHEQLGPQRVSCVRDQIKGDLGVITLVSYILCPFLCILQHAISNRLTLGSDIGYEGNLSVSRENG